MWKSFLTGVLLTFYILQVSGGERELSCNVTRDADVVKYVILDKAHELDSSCKFSWINSSKHVLSTYKKPSGEGWNSSINSLNISRCLENITFNGHCTRSGYVFDYIASCSCNCTVQALIHEDTGGLDWSPFWIAIVSIAILVAVVLVLGLIAALIWKIKKKKGWTPKDGLQAAYKCVRNKDNHPQPSDVEAGRE